MRIAFYDNVPIIGYFLLQGRCRYCAKTFSIRYPLIELFEACLAGFLVWQFGLGFWSTFYFIFVSVLVIIFFIDIDYRIIPNTLSIPGIVIGLVASLLMPLLIDDWFVGIKESILGCLFGGGFLYGINYLYSMVTGRDGIGFGDVKLMAMLGAFFGAKIVLLTIFLSSLLGSLVGFAVVLVAGKTSKYPIPFGPFIVVSCLLALWIGDKLISSVFY
jgi:leader peptidase (prepilin peptidase)/N-methyltransferase